MTPLWRMAIICGLLRCGAQLGAADVNLAWGSAYDSNLYEATTGAQGGFVSRFFMTVDAQPLRTRRLALGLQQQAGVKRFWSAPTGQSESGDVLVYQLSLQGQTRLGARLAVLTGGNAKFKQATRVPGEESYLRGGLFANFLLRLSPLLTAGSAFRAGADDSRDAILPEVAYREAELNLRFARDRRLRGRVHVSLQWLHYNRVVLLPSPSGDPSVVLGKSNQADRLQTLGVDVQAYHGMLMQAAYDYLRNHSNSFGYAYRAHRFQGMVIRHIGLGVDAQVFAQVQFRTYVDALPLLQTRASEADEYEQTLAIVKLSRQVTAHYGFSVQYAFYRNGARQGDAFYRKHVCSIALEGKL